VKETGDARVRARGLRALQVLAFATVAGLLALLVWRVVTDGRGDQLVRDLRAGNAN
jgi:hypothetical protein